MFLKKLWKRAKISGYMYKFQDVTPISGHFRTTPRPEKCINNTHVTHWIVPVSSSAGRHCGLACHLESSSSSSASWCVRTTVPGARPASSAWSASSWSRPECWAGRVVNGHQAALIPTGAPPRYDIPADLPVHTPTPANAKPRGGLRHFDQQWGHQLWDAQDVSVMPPAHTQGDHSPDTLKFPDNVRHSCPC